MTDRQLLTLTAALLAARRRRPDVEAAVADALRLWYYVGGELGPRLARVPPETALDHIKNALQIFAATEGPGLDAEQLAGVKRRLESALAALQG